MLKSIDRLAEFLLHVANPLSGYKFLILLIMTLSCLELLTEGPGFLFGSLVVSAFCLSLLDLCLRILPATTILYLLTGCWGNLVKFEIKGSREFIRGLCGGTSVAGPGYLSNLILTNSS